MGSSGTHEYGISVAVSGCRKKRARICAGVRARHRIQRWPAIPLVRALCIYATAADVDYGGGGGDVNGNAQAAYYTAVRGGSWRRGGPKGSSLIREQQLASNAFSVSSVPAPPVCRVCSVSVRPRVFCVRVT